MLRLQRYCPDYDSRREAGSRHRPEMRCHCFLRSAGHPPKRPDRGRASCAHDRSRRRRRCFQHAPLAIADRLLSPLQHQAVRSRGTCSEQAAAPPDRPIARRGLFELQDLSLRRPEVRLALPPRPLRPEEHGAGARARLLRGDRQCGRALRFAQPHRGPVRRARLLQPLLRSVHGQEIRVRPPQGQPADPPAVPAPGQPRRVCRVYLQVRAAVRQQAYIRWRLARRRPHSRRCSRPRAIFQGWAATAPVRQEPAPPRLPLEGRRCAGLTRC